MRCRSQMRHGKDGVQVVCAIRCRVGKEEQEQRWEWAPSKCPPSKTDQHKQGVDDFKVGGVLKSAGLRMAGVKCTITTNATMAMHRTGWAKEVHQHAESAGSR